MVYSGALPIYTSSSYTSLYYFPIRSSVTPRPLPFSHLLIPSLFFFGFKDFDSPFSSFPPPHTPAHTCLLLRCQDPRWCDTASRLSLSWTATATNSATTVTMSASTGHPRLSNCSATGALPGASAWITIVARAVTKTPRVTLTEAL